MNVLSCEQIEELLPAYALNVASADERAAVDAHVDACPRCADALREIRAVTHGLALRAPRVQPPPGQRAAVLGRVATASASPRSVQSHSHSGVFERVVAFLSDAQIARAMLALLLVVGAGAAVYVGSLSANDAVVRQRVVANSTISVPLKGAPERAPNATGRIVYRPGDRVAVIEVKDMPRPPAGRKYCLWLVYRGEDGKNARDVGAFFEVGEDGVAQLLINSPRPMDSYLRFGVSDEPADTPPKTPSGQRYIGS
jgi:anti-sigma factor RsiW